jgi:hypothetical protein
MADKFYNPIDIPEVASIPSPSSGHHTIHAKADGHLHSKNSEGVEHNLSKDEVLIDTLPDINYPAIGFESVTIDGQQVYKMKVNN